MGIFDTYVRRARLQPALIVTLPIAFAILAASPLGVATWGSFWAIIVACGGTSLLSQVARDAGKRKEPALYQLWGGAPTTRMLRHRDSANQVLRNRRHRSLEKVVPGAVMPSAAAEAADPTGADAAYESCVVFLRDKTRDRKRFKLVFDELCSYGFRRNLWGMRPLGLALAIAGVAAVATLVVFHARQGVTIGQHEYIAGGLNLLLLVGWLFWFTTDWVRIPADAYAERLLSTCDDLEADLVASSKHT